MPRNPFQSPSRIQLRLCDGLSFGVYFEDSITSLTVGTQSRTFGGGIRTLALQHSDPCVFDAYESGSA
eukprot:1899302-Alexandrium_andersonii.AAC.1